MTIKLSKFGKTFITRQDATIVLQSTDIKEVPVLDFSGVTVANHPFADELGKGLISCLSLQDLSAIKIEGANGYVKRSMKAGFSTAVA